ncbi:kunitz-type serine protease inhibitor homolog alpha-dendrotoxin [Drosophila teissieri]|uniref:kunitz-type serine protease inhibitor homolog alpha-dendrotoxin n=1 Tax=Drosophila teissieri TaxID=7243 RepID=UPI001CB9E20E|nr:kunitz-type serine protease inhibitor homolog alpha-dendrotoxin [Drosophila teissieri]
MKLLLVLACVVLYASLAYAQDRCDGRPSGRQNCVGGKNEGRGGGHCHRTAMDEMWYYNQRSGRCIKMKYLGCGGNQNRYCSLRHCQRSCP